VDELNHLHVLPNEPGGVLVAFNLSEQPAERQLLIDPAELRLSAQQPLPAISNAQANGTMAVSNCGSPSRRAAPW